MGNITNDTLNKANGLAQDLKGKVQHAEAQLGKMTHEAGDRVSDMASSFADQASEYAKIGRNYVKENPAKGVAIAAAAGALAGGLIAYFMRPRR